MVNINIEIPEDLHKQLKLSSLMKDQSLKQYVTTALDKRIPKHGQH